MAQMKEQIKTPEKVLMRIANLSDAECKTLVIRMLRELIEYRKHLREEIKATLSEIKKYWQGTNSKGKKARVQINNLGHKEEINSQSAQNEETRIQKKKKTEERIRRFWDISKCANIQIIGMPEGEEEEQKIANLFEQIMKENLPNLAKEIDFQEVQEAQSSK